VTRKSRREVEREVRDLSDRADDGRTPKAAVEITPGEYVTPAGDPVDWDEVIFKIPNELWCRWKEEGETDEVPGFERLSE
jgi:hypothetical protein